MINIPRSDASLNAYAANNLAESGEPQNVSTNGAAAAAPASTAASPLADPLSKFAAMFGLHPATQQATNQPARTGTGTPSTTPQGGAGRPSAPTYGGPGKTSQLTCNESGLDDAPTTKVQSGESSLEQVADRLGLDADELARANPQIKDPAALSAGQVIRLPEEAKLSGRADVEWPQCATDSATDARAEVAEAHRIYKSTGQVPQTLNQLSPIEIREGRLMSQAERYDAMLAKQGKSHPQIGDLVHDRRDPDYLTKQEFKDELFKREQAEWNQCKDEYIRPGKIDKCQRGVNEKYGGEDFKEWRTERERAGYRELQRVEGKIEGIAGSGPVGLVGRIVGRAIGGEKGEEIGGAIGGLIDAGLGAKADAKQMGRQAEQEPPPRMRKEASAHISGARPPVADTPAAPGSSAATKKMPAQGRETTTSEPPPAARPSGGVLPARGEGSPREPLESKGAAMKGPSFVSATAKTESSVITSVRADVGEAQAYSEAIYVRGEIGLQRPAGANVRGVDFITARRNAAGEIEVLITDVKTSTKGEFPKPATSIKPAWQAEVEAAVAEGRLDLGDPALEAEVRDAVKAGRVELRQVEVDMSPRGQGRMSGF